MDILLITYEFPPAMATGGIGSYMYHLSHLLESVGHRVTVFSATSKGIEVYREDHPHCTNYLFPAQNQEKFREKVTAFFHGYIKKYNVDVIESPEVGACALGIKQDYPAIPLIVRTHTPGVLITRVSNVYQPLHQKLRFVVGAIRRGKLDLGFWSRKDKNRNSDPEYGICLMADRLVSPTYALKKYLSSFWCIKKDIEVIPNPFHADNDLFQYSLERREKIICYVGKLTVLKGMFAFSKAMKHILRNYPDYQLVIAGRDEAVSASIPSMKAWMMQELNEVKDQVSFMGVLSRDEVKQLLSKSRICVVPSLWENFPTVLLEAMAAGTLIAASNRGGIPEMVKSGISGYLFNPMRPRKIVKAVRRLLEQDASCYWMAENARQWVRQLQISSDQTILELYKSMVNINKQS